MPPEIFHGAKLKIKRANQHVYELNELLASFVKTDFCRFSVEKDASTGNHVLKFEMTKSAPCEVPLIIGDAIHNLRSALDLAACEIVTLGGATPSKWCSFPFRDSRKELEDSINGGEIKIAGADIVNLILDVVKPYKGGNDPLCALHALDITDKHKLLIPIFSIAALKHVNLRAGPMSMTDCTLAVGDGGKLNILAMPGKIEFEGYGEPAFAVLFDKGQVFERQPVVPTLKQLSEVVSGVIQAIEKAYLAREQGSGHGTPAPPKSPPTAEK